MKGTPVKAKKKTGDAVNVDGAWAPMPLVPLGSRGIASLSPNASKMLIFFIAQLKTNGYGNGRLDAHPDHLRVAGWTSKASASAAIDELIRANLLVRTRLGRKGRIGLYGLTFWPMYCKHEELDIGPGAWAITDWRDAPDATTPMTAENPAVWNRPRASTGQTDTAAKRKRSPRHGGESVKCSPATGANGALEPQCSPATGAHSGVLSGNAPPPRGTLYRYPSARAAALPATPARHRRLGLVLAQRIKHSINPAHRAAVLDFCRRTGLHRTAARNRGFIIPERLK